MKRAFASALIVCGLLSSTSSAAQPRTRPDLASLRGGPDAASALARQLQAAIAAAQARAAAEHADAKTARAEIQAAIEQAIVTSGLDPEIARDALRRLQLAYRGCAPAVMFYQQFNCFGDVVGALRVVQDVVTAEINANNPLATGGQNGGGLLTAPILPAPSANATASYVGNIPG